MLASGGCWIRTNEGKSRQVYSLLPLATRETLQETVFNPCACSPQYLSIRAGEGTRTPNRLFTKQVLYLLSYTSESRRQLVPADSFACRSTVQQR